MSSALSLLSKDTLDGLPKQDFPDWVNPMLATLTHDHFSDPEWLYERKLDGERCLAFAKDGDVRLFSRNQKELNDTYPELEAALAENDMPDCVLDGEVVAFSGEVTSFSRLQGRMQVHDREEAKDAKIAVFFYLFDIMHLDGRDVTGLELRTRKKLLRKTLTFAAPLRYTTHRNQTGLEYLSQACDSGWEGLIAKDGRGTYVHSRSRKWLKFKCVNQQELVIGGFTDPKGSRTGFGAILVGHYQDGNLVYAGKIGTGFDEKTLDRLSRKFHSLERETSPFDRGEPRGDGVHFITPELVCEAGFTEWTENGKLRHPRYLGLRRDKDPEKVVREDTR